MFSGIIANVQKEADRSRMVILEMHRLPRDEEQRRQLFENLEHFDTNIGARFLRRMLNALASGIFDACLSSLITSIRLVGGDERKADVFAHLLAAHHVLTKDSEITKEEAAALADLVTDIDEGEPSDEEACLSHLLGHLVIVDYGYKRTLGEWIEYLREDVPTGPTFRTVQAELERHGVKFERNGIKVGNATPGIETVYKGSRWKRGGHWRVLRRLDGAGAAGNARFAGHQSKCTVIPRKLLCPEDGS
jgi:hypothetical protein